MKELKGEDQAFDICIIGMGIAGTHVVRQFLSDPYFQNKRILILDPAREPANKSISFWTQTDEDYKSIIRHKWGQIDLYDQQRSIQLHTKPYKYATLYSQDFIMHYRRQLQELSNYALKYETANHCTLKNSNWIINTDAGNQYAAIRVLDSRPNVDLKKISSPYSLIYQHFLGWEIYVESDVFNPDCATIMDFRLADNETQFFYVLPTSKNHALIENTYFTTHVLTEENYEKVIHSYLEKHDIKCYNIITKEQGVIPMTDFPFHTNNSRNYIKIGTPGGWVKASTGYSFSSAERKSILVSDCIKQDNDFRSIANKRKFNFYDSVFLKVLSDRNALGPSLFMSMFQKNPIDRNIRFLEERSSLFDELCIILSFPKLPFIKALFRRFIKF